MSAYVSRIDSTGREQVVTGRSAAKSPIRHLDLSLLFVILALSTFGVIAIRSATRHRQLAFGEDPDFFVKRQIVFICVALVLFLGMLLFDYRQLRTLSPLVFAGGLVLLLLVLTGLGQKVAGAQRWVSFGFFQLQPSELMKVVLLVTLAALYADEKVEPGPRHLAAALGIIAVPAVLTYFQPDLGTLMVLATVFLSVLLLSGTRMRWLLVTVLIGLAAFTVVLQLGILQEYQVARLTAFLDAEADAQRAGYNLAQSKIAIGAGGFNGKGLLQGSQTNLDYVPEQHTDFIFTVIAEETGFRGSIVLLGLYGLLLWRALRIAMLSRDRFGMLLAGGVAGMLVFQAFVNIGMTMGIMPITGIPLPFVSYGGSSLITSFLAVALLMNVHMRRFV